MEQMHEISFERIDDGSIRLEQQSGHGERDVIRLHPEQLKYITRRMCGMDSATVVSIEDLERRISILADKLVRLVDAKWFRDEIIERCGSGIEMLAKLDGIVDLAVEFDGGRLLPTGTQTAMQDATNNPNSKPNTDTPARAENTATSHGVSQSS